MTRDYRSLLDKTHEQASAHWQRHGDTRLISHYGESREPGKQAFRCLACMDLSPLRRYGLKGADINTSLRSMGLEAGDQSNRAYPQSDGSLIARLAPGELLILADPLQADREIRLPADADRYECYVVPRQNSHYWFAISGEKSHEMLAKLCGVDCSPAVFANHHVAQTRVAKTSAVVVRNDIKNCHTYYLLGDNSYITYMWACLREAMIEFNGQFIGISAIG